MAIELPTILTFLDDTFKTPLTKFLHDWDSIVISVFIGVLISLLFHFGLKKKAMKPKGLQNILEGIAEGMNLLVTEVLGKDGKKYIPLIGTLFVYILTMNLFGLVPLMKAPSANLNVTIALAIVVFCYIQYRNFKNLGVKGFLYHLAGSPTTTSGWMMAPLMFPLELLTQISRPVTLALR
ncbi:MAG: F0F1 ATP synthase subunit A, partial [Parachlamydiaceae bacterium]